MRRRALATAVAGIGLLLPGAASAAVRQIDVLENSSEYCVTVDNGPTSVDFAVRTPDGGTISTIHVATATAGTNCNGDPAVGQSSFVASSNISGGTTVVATANTGVTATFPVPYSAYDQTGTTTATFKVGGLPTAGGTVKFNGGGANAYTGSTYTTPTPITISGGLVAIASTIGAVPFLASLNASQFYIEASYYGDVTMRGVDPLGAPLTVSVASGGATFESGGATVGADNNGTVDIQLAAPLPVGASVTGGQVGWFTHTATLGVVNIHAGGFDVSIPNVPGETGNVNPELTFQKTSGLAASDPLSCKYFGDATYMTSSCSSPVARYSASFPAIVAASDRFYVDTTEADGDVTSVTAAAPGLWASLVDGTLEVAGVAPGASTTLTATAPSGASASGNTISSQTGYAYMGSEDGDAQNFVPLKIVPGTTIVASGPAVGTPRSYVANLAAHVSGTSVVGTTYPNGHIAIQIGRSTGSDSVYGTADGSGAFSLDVGAALPGDRFYVYASDAAGTASMEVDLFPGESQPAITGLIDQQLVHGTVTAGATGAGPGGISWTGDGPKSVSSTAPFTYTFDTTLVKDGLRRITASSTGGRHAMSDYLYVRVDNTAPMGTAGPDQSVGLGQSAVFVTGAYDANGVASVSETFGDGTSQSQAGADIGLPLVHAYAKAGTYTATLVVTDAAGNKTTDTATIHVLSKLSSQLGGKLPATVKHKKNLKVKLTGKTPGQLTVHVYGKRFSLKASRVVRFTKANQKVTFTLATKKWKRGSYTVMLQFIDSHGTPGPVVLQTLKVV